MKFKPNNQPVLTATVMLAALVAGCSRTRIVQGTPGPKGDDGANASPCTVTAIGAEPNGPLPNGGAQITCPDGTGVLIANGSNGTDGQDGQDGTDGQDGAPAPIQIVGVVDPCGDAPNIFDEVFLKLADGTLVASMSANMQGDLTRLVEVPVNTTLVTTDGDACTFSVDEDGNILNPSHSN